MSTKNLLPVFTQEIKNTPPCRVLRSFEPAFAGMGSSTEIRLDRSLSRHSSDIGTLLIGVGSKPVVLHHEHSRATFLIPQFLSDV